MKFPPITETVAPPMKIDTKSGYGNRYAFITLPGVGYATVDFGDRVFRAGLSLAGEPLFRRCAGRGWRQLLVDGACKWLSAIQARRFTNP